MPDQTTGSLAERARSAVFSRVAQEAFEIVDAHAHLGCEGVMFIPEHESAALVATMDRCGVSLAVASSMLAIRQDVMAGNDQTAGVVDTFPGRYAGAMVINPWQDVSGELRRWADDARMSAVKLHPDVHEYPLTGDRYEPVWEFAARTGCPVLTHTWHGSTFDGWPEVADVCARHPEVNLIAGHTGVDPKGFDAAIRIAAVAPRLYLELCGSQSHGRYVERLVSQVGRDRVLYGSDFPFIEMRTGLGRALFADLDDDALTRLLGTTTRGLLSWRGRAG